MTPRAASPAELLLATQLEQAGIPYVREFVAAAPRKYRWDFYLGDDLLVEIDGGAWVGGRHVRGSGVESDAEKSAMAAIRGYRFIRVTPAQVDDGRALAWIQQALERAA